MLLSITETQSIFDDKAFLCPTHRKVFTKRNSHRSQKFFEWFTSVFSPFLVDVVLNAAAVTILIDQDSKSASSPLQAKSYTGEVAVIGGYYKKLAAEWIRQLY